MRLIDADAFEKFIKDKYKDGESTDDIKDQILFDLSYQPTAYDPEAVVKELENKFEQTVAEILDKTGSDFTIADFNVKRYSDRICEIVRKGGAT